MALGSGMTCFSSGMRGVVHYSVVRAGGMCCVWKSDRKEETEADRQTEERVDVCVDVCVSFCTAAASMHISDIVYQGKARWYSGADGMRSLVREVPCFSSMGISERDDLL